MSVKQVMIVSIVPASTSARSSSRVSMPLAAPSILGPITCVTVVPPLRARGGGRLGGLGSGGTEILVDGAHRSRVLVLCRDYPPDSHEDPDHEDERRIVQVRPVEV